MEPIMQTAYKQGQRVLDHVLKDLVILSLNGKQIILVMGCY